MSRAGVGHVGWSSSSCCVGLRHCVCHDAFDMAWCRRPSLASRAVDCLLHFASGVVNCVAACGESVRDGVDFAICEATAYI
jgi:hypothetical protein